MKLTTAELGSWYAIMIIPKLTSFRRLRDISIKDDIDSQVEGLGLNETFAVSQTPFCAIVEETNSLLVSVCGFIKNPNLFEPLRLRLLCSPKIAAVTRYDLPASKPWQLSKRQFRRDRRAVKKQIFIQSKVIKEYLWERMETVECAESLGKQLAMAVNLDGVTEEVMSHTELESLLAELPEQIFLQGMIELHQIDADALQKELGPETLVDCGTIGVQIIKTSQVLSELYASALETLDLADDSIIDESLTEFAVKTVEAEGDISCVAFTVSLCNEIEGRAVALRCYISPEPLAVSQPC